MKAYDNSPLHNAPLWFGVGEDNWYTGGAVAPLYDDNNKIIVLEFINNGVITDDEYENITDNIVSLAWRKIRSGEVKIGDTDYIKINLNGEVVNSTYVGSLTFTADVKESPAEIGRFWQYQNQNRTANSAIQAIRVYNRALTDEEMKRNYEIDNYRFNLN